jgi:hypothetical protein
MYNHTSGEWTFLSGSSGINTYGTYGASGVEAPGITPGAREFASMALFPQDNVILVFGGQGYAASGGQGELNSWNHLYEHV